VQKWNITDLDADGLTKLEDWWMNKTQIQILITNCCWNLKIQVMISMYYRKQWIMLQFLRIRTLCVTICI
jgi:hypothetical protein